MLNLNTKEKSLLEDAKEHETLCVAKYKDHAEKTNCQELKNLFNSLASKEQQHLDTINPVSYTHLDVYKRQSLGISLSNSNLKSFTFIIFCFKFIILPTK